MSRILIKERVRDLSQRVRQQVTLEDFLKHYVFPLVPYKVYDLSKLDPYAVQVSIICPFHDETKPSFRLFRKYSEHFDDWYCFGACRSGGGIVELYRHMQLTFYGKKIGYIDALVALADLYNIPYTNLYEDSETLEKKIQSTSISLKDIMKNLQQGPLELESTPSANAYQTMLENALVSLKETNIKAYIEYMNEFDYIMSLMLEENERCLELESLYNQYLAYKENIEGQSSGHECNCSLSQ